MKYGFAGFIDTPNNRFCNVMEQGGGPNRKIFAVRQITCGQTVMEHVQYKAPLLTGIHAGGKFRQQNIQQSRSVEKHEGGGRPGRTKDFFKFFPDTFSGN
jgi:hypothetical protein